MVGWEILGIVAGLVVGVGVGVLAAAHSRPGGAGPESSELALRVKTLEADFERLRLDFQDTLDKVHHLYDRTRKRLDLASPNGTQIQPVLTGKAAIRARLRAAGMLR